MSRSVARAATLTDLLSFGVASPISEALTRTNGMGHSFGGQDS
jgi:hypothetical protein